MKNEWMTRQRYCPNCGTLGLCYSEGENRFRFRCTKCSLESVLKLKNRRCSQIEEYLPKYMSRLMELQEDVSEECFDF